MDETTTRGYHDETTWAHGFLQAFVRPVYSTDEAYLLLWLLGVAWDLGHGDDMACRHGSGI